MALYLKAIKLDLSKGFEYTVIIHENDAKREGISTANPISMSIGGSIISAFPVISSTEVEEGFLGIYFDIWSKYPVVNDTFIRITNAKQSESIEIIRKKILGKKMTKEEIYTVMHEMGSKKLGSIETAYFMSTFFSPGFDDEETQWLIEGMAHSGDVLDFKKYSQNGLVVDKHSIGGVAGKAVTPLLVPIIASCGLIIPNTSTRAITSPAGTSDILEVVMPIGFTPEQIYKIVEKTGACMIWGGAVDLAPADDVLIQVEKVIHMESYQKILVSIIAKKIAMGVTHIIMDIPYGKGTKVQNTEDVSMLENMFIDYYNRVGIKCVVHKRFVKGPDGKSIGPNLEMREVLEILERNDSRDVGLENLALTMAGKLLELCGYSKFGDGFKDAKEKLDNKMAYEKFWEIAKAQGATKVVSYKDIEVGEYSYEVVSPKSGKIEYVDNKELMRISRVLGTPESKVAGIRLEKNVGDSVKEGEKLMTFYASAGSRIEAVKEYFKIENLISFS